MLNNDILSQPDTTWHLWLLLYSRVKSPHYMLHSESLKWGGYMPGDILWLYGYMPESFLVIFLLFCGTDIQRKICIALDSTWVVFLLLDCQVYFMTQAIYLVSETWKQCANFLWVVILLLYLSSLFPRWRIRK